MKKALHKDFFCADVTIITSTWLSFTEAAVHLPTERTALLDFKELGSCVVVSDGHVRGQQLSKSSHFSFFLLSQFVHPWFRPFSVSPHHLWCEQRRQGGDTRREESRRQALNKMRHPRFGAVVLKMTAIAYDASYRGEMSSPWNAVTTAPYEALHKQWRARGLITLLIILNNWYNVWYKRNASVESCSHPWFTCSSCRPRLF